MIPATGDPPRRPAAAHVASTPSRESALGRWKTRARRWAGPRLWSLLGNLRRTVMIALFRPRSITRSYGGRRLTIRLADPISRNWYDHDWDSLPDIDLLARGKLRPGAVVFDIGAHQGVVALLLASVVGPDGRVIAVEADPHNARAGKENCKLNSAHRVQFVTAAVAAKPGLVRFCGGLNGRLATDPSNRTGREMRAVTIDDLAAAHGTPDVLFIDIEGAECEALAGAERTLAARPDCFVEIHGGCGLEELGGSSRRVLGFFPASDYDLYFNDTGSFAPLGADASLPAGRWFLVALSRRSPR